MQFFSTRDRNRVVSASQAIAQGLSDEGGLFVPQSFPQVDVQAICGLEYPEMAAAIVGQYLTDYSQRFLAEAAKATYGEAFGGKAGYLAPVSTACIRWSCGTARPVRSRITPSNSCRSFWWRQKESEPHREDPDPRGDQRRYR